VIVDTVQIPKSIAPGDYILGWRYDAEETAQVWQNCADVTIIPAVEPVVAVEEGVEVEA
jgi:hypothetical protein